MNILTITVTSDALVFRTDAACPSGLTVREYAPLADRLSVQLSAPTAGAVDGGFSIPRYDGDRDRLFSEFTVCDGETRLGGARFVTDFAPDLPENRGEYPQPSTIKALSGTPEDIRELQLQQTPVNVNLPAMMTTQPGDNAIPFVHNGKTYYFLRDQVEKLDAMLRYAADMGLLVTLILLNSPRLFGSTQEEALLKDCIHPDFDWHARDTFISAFNMRTPEGQGLYCAFVEFLAGRYTRPDAKYGRVAGAIVSNEVNSQYIWGNAGEMDVKDYAAEYMLAMRLAWLCGRKHCAYFRVYLSLDQHWCDDVHDPRYPKRYYPGRDVVDSLAAHSRESGDFPWHIAYHPYPEDLHWPDFWHDRAADFTFSTRKITFKNMEMLEAYLAQPHLLCRGLPRRIIFSEQGFNSQSGPLQQLTEQMAAAGYVLAYLKARQMKTVDMMTHHAYVDNPHEFGLNLGIRRYDPDMPWHAGEKKPIYYAVRDMETPAEAARIEQARAFIGSDLFDYLLDPPILRADRDASVDSDFGN